MAIVRPAAEADAARVHGLIEALEAPQRFPYEPFRQNYLNNLACHDNAYLVAEQAGVVVAFGSLRFGTPLHHPKPVAEIVELVVDEQYRGKSVGALLVGEMERLARARGCCRLEVTSNRVRGRAHGFYIRNGFSQTHVTLTMDLDGETE